MTHCVLPYPLSSIVTLKQAIIIDKSDPANFKFETENITVHRDSNGFAVDENGRVLVPVDRIV
jgi:hypothetical protein